MRVPCARSGATEGRSITPAQYDTGMYDDVCHDACTAVVVRPSYSSTADG